METTVNAGVALTLESYFVFYAFVFLFIIVAGGLVARSIYCFQTTPGSLMDRLSAAWKGSMTILVLGWAAILTLGMNLLDLLNDVTGDPMFGQLSESIKGVIPASYHPYIPPVVFGIAIATRLTHNPPERSAPTSVVSPNPYIEPPK